MNKKTAAVVTAAEGPIHIAAMETNVFRQLMNLVEHIAVTRYSDGSPRQTGWFTLKTLGAQYAIQVKDPDGAVSFQAIAPALDDALVLADLLVASPEAPWQPDKFLADQQRGKKKGG